ncbi:uncharacterized protein LOC144102743 [Amblyomma americanum]
MSLMARATAASSVSSEVSAAGVPKGRSFFIVMETTEERTFFPGPSSCLLALCTAQYGELVQTDRDLQSSCSKANVKGASSTVEHRATTGRPIFATGGPSFATGRPCFATGEPSFATVGPIFPTGGPSFATGINITALFSWSMAMGSYKIPTTRAGLHAAASPVAIVTLYFYQEPVAGRLAE